MQRFTLETRLRLKQNMVLYTDKKKLETQEVNETLHVNLLLICLFDSYQQEQSTSNQYILACA